MTENTNNLVDVAAAEERGIHWSDAVAWHPLTDAGDSAPAVSADPTGATSTESPASPPTTTKPAVGDTVHYTDNINQGGGHARCIDAEVITVNTDGTIDLREHPPLGPAYAIGEGKPGDLYTWHWPEPTEAERETNRLLHHITGGDFL